MKIIFEGKSFIFICHDRDKGISCKITGITHIFFFTEKILGIAQIFYSPGVLKKKSKIRFYHEFVFSYVMTDLLLMILYHHL